MSQAKGEPRDMILRSGYYDFAASIKFRLLQNGLLSATPDALCSNMDRFEDEMNKLPLEIGSPMALAKKFGGSNHAAIRRYAEICKKRCALIVLEDKASTGNKYSLDLRNSFQSNAFTKDFGEIIWPEKLNIDYPFIGDYSRGRRIHKDGSIQLMTSTGFEEFTYHYFFNQYNVFILIIPVGEKIKSKTKIIMAK